MGCTSSSDAYQTDKLLTSQKPSVWLIGGGPGSNKGKICEYIVRDYKFKYLSSYDIIQFQQDRGGPDAEQIKRIFKNGEQLPSKLIVRLVKKAIASCGIRRFIIDGFPSTIEDIQEFSKEITSKEIDFYGYIQILISSEKMKESGLKAHESDPGDKAEIQKKIMTTINNYQDENKKIRKQYELINKYMKIDGNQGPDQAYSEIREYLTVKNIHPPKPVKVFFAHFDDPKHEVALCDDLVRKYGLYYYTPAELILECKYKSNSVESGEILKLEQQKKQIPAPIVLSLIRKKIEKHDYAGNFLISGYPRNISDAEDWDRQFGWETQILGYLTFEIPDEKFKQLFTEREQANRTPSSEIDSKFQKYQASQKQISIYYQKKNLILKIDAKDQSKALSDIHLFFKSRMFHSRPKLCQKQLLFINCTSGPSVSVTNQPLLISFSNLLQAQIKSKGLYSELIESYLRINKPIPGIIGTKIVLTEILKRQSEANQRSIAVQGFPQSAQQLQSWQEEVGEAIKLSGIIYYEFDEKYVEESIRQTIKENKINLNEKEAINITKRFANQLQNKVSCSDWKSLKLNRKEEQKNKSKVMHFLKDILFIA